MKLELTDFKADASDSELLLAGSQMRAMDKLSELYTLRASCPRRRRLRLRNQSIQRWQAGRSHKMCKALVGEESLLDEKWWCLRLWLLAPVAASIS